MILGKLFHFSEFPLLHFYKMEMIFKLLFLTTTTQKLLYLAHSRNTHKNRKGSFSSESLYPQFIAVSVPGTIEIT